jgi:putrescine transport system substrate-binding protein
MPPQDRGMLRGLAAAVLLFASGPALAQARVVNVYNWSDYIAKDVLQQFERESGIKVRYDTFDSNDVLQTKLLAGKTGYDVVVPTSTFLANQIAAGALRKLDKAKLPNLKNLDPELMARLGKIDPGNQYAVIYLWGTTGIGINRDKVKAALANPPSNSLAMVFDPAVVAKFAPCGVSLLDAPDEVVPAALRFLGLNPDSKAPADLAKAEAQLLKIRPYVRKFHSSQYINDLANGDGCLALGWSGDVLQARQRAIEAKNKVAVQYLLPREGALQWFDTLAIPTDARNLDNAHAFINFLLKPEVIARITNEVKYPNAVPASLARVSKEAKEDADVFPPPAVVKQLYTVTPPNQAEQRTLTRLWTKVKAGG